MRVAIVSMVLSPPPLTVGAWGLKQYKAQHGASEQPYHGSVQHNKAEPLAFWVAGHTNRGLRCIPRCCCLMCC